MYLLLQYRPLRWSWGGKQAGQGNVYNDGYAIVLLQSYQTLTHPACYPPPAVSQRSVLYCVKYIYNISTIV